MTDYVIHTFGGGDILWQVFNGIGRVFASNSEYFTPVGQFALTIGGIWAATRAIFRGNISIFAMEWFFPSLFIFIFLFAPKANIWLKDEISMQAPVKIDNIPIGIAFFASISSKISYSLSETLEKHLLPPDEGLSSRKNGIMFGAKAIGKIKDIQIEDPVTLSNTKEFLRQCFMKPYIIGNILGKKAEAQRASDIIAFIQQNMPNNFGIYYKDPSNSTISFKTCKQVTPLIKAAINKELNDGLLTKFANGIGISSGKQEMLASRLKAMTLKYLKKEQTDIHQWMRQAMLLNANREAYDDLREKFSLSRIYPQLVSMNATRGLFQQSFSYLVAGEMAANIMPILQSVFFALVICLIFIVFPMSMLPGGYTIFKTWITLIIWVTSWPVFFTVIHCLGMISLAGKSANHLTGLNILSQGSFSEILLHEFATFQMLAASVPMLSWAVLKACAHATTTLANQFSPVPVASSIGANIADNNLAMDNYSIGNRTIAQQNLTPTLQLAGGIIDYGGMRVTSTDSGRQVLTQAVDSLVNNYRSSKLLQDSYQSQFMSSQSYLDSLSDRYSDLTTTGNSIATEIGKRLSYEEAKSIGITDSEYLALQQINSDSISATDHTGSSNRKGTSTSADIGLNVPSLGGTKVGSSNDKVQDQGKSVNQQQSYNEALSKIKSATKDGRLGHTNSDLQSLSNNLNSNFSEQQSVGQEIAKTKQNIEQLSCNMNYIAQNSAVIDRNLNEPVLNSIIAKNIPGVSSKEQAAMWAGTHQKEAEQIALDIAKINNTIPQNLSSTSSSRIPTKESLRSNFDKNTKQLNDQAAISSIDDRKNDVYDKSIEQMLINNIDDNEVEKVKILEQLSDKVKDKKAQIQDEFNKTPESTIVRTGQKIADNLEISDKAIKKRNIKLSGYKNENN
ncbi:conjugal transfer protein TraG N-terminal domain-containing protein [Rickettsia endosymbiont of Ixodes scapularis]|uniref:conjugal transfer protein TraG N-terminal domain-containing protein n=1 Tax=Rickettsia endosymbiont of Ixodes scapularis TaxID=444612 RepID=UPI0001A60575|nr:conjugal transfer protein TraG N-terminal domain-containing protein [Rickettsia endosymbiont of Ixodes scapularis]EER22350.1 conjugative transfer protein TraG [Rickettsia endosymbiont of Ixodes scapularis]